MELNDTVRRIFGAHSRLIAAFVLGGLVVALLLQVAAGKTYSSTARLVLDTPDPQSLSEAQAIADMAKAIATSPEQVGEALRAADVRGRNALEIARDHVSVQALGTSAVLELSVSDRSPSAAAALTNALAARVIDVRSAVSNGKLQQAMSDLQERIVGLNSKIAALDVRADTLAVQLAQARSQAQASALRSRHDEAVQSRDLLIQQRSVAESERVSLLSANAARPRPSIISRATIPTGSSGGHWFTHALEGALLGLILGVGTAAVIETIRPTVAGSKKLAEALGTPLIGVLDSVYPGERPAAVEDLTPLGTRLRIVGDAAGAHEIGLVPADGHVDLGGLATALESARSALNGLDLRPVDLGDYEVNGRRETTVVLVSPTRLKRAELLALDHRLSLTSSTLLGLITYHGPRERRWPWSQARDRVAVVDRD